MKARCVQKSDISSAPPHVREIWDWLLLSANYSDQKTSGKVISRGQQLTSYKDILNGLSWYVGYRKCSYSKGQCEIAMKWLTKREMITTTKTTRGMIITICNYSRFQDYKNYENYTDKDNGTTMEPQGHDRIRKEGKEGKKESIVHEVLAYLKEVTGKSYKPTTLAHAKWINARVADGHGLDDFKHVVDVKSSQWLGDSNNDKFLRPETLFGNRFEGYRNEKGEPYAVITVDSKEIVFETESEYTVYKEGLS